MAKFVDSEGDEWSIRITSGHLDDLFQEQGVKLDGFLDPDEQTNGLVTALSDRSKFVDIIWFFCAAQGEKRGMDKRAFGYRFDGETIERAGIALWSAMVNFSRPRTEETAAAAFRTGLNKQTAHANAALEKLAESLTFGSGAAKSEVASALTPDRSPSENSSGTTEATGTTLPI